MDNNNNIYVDPPLPPPPPRQTVTKLRLMCSYGGRIMSVPHKLKSLFYAGGDTRIISVPAAAASASLAAFSSHIAAALQVWYPFTLKYQLPLHELDSLVSLASDEDLVIFLEELQRPSSARVRLFLFPTESTKSQHGLTHPKTESWFSDALKSAKMMQTGGGEMGGGENGGGGGLCGQESLLLETTSPFGSSSSSVSLSNLPPIKACGDDSKTLLPSNESTASDIGSMMGAVSYGQPVTYQDPVIPAKDNKVSLNTVDLLDGKVPDLVPGLPVHNTGQVAGYPLSTQSDQLQQQQLQFVQMSNPTNVLPVTSYYPSYTTMSPHQPIQCLSNQSYPVYVVPVGQARGYTASPQYHSKEAMAVVSGRPPLHPLTSVNSPQVAYKDVTAVPPVPGFVSQVYRTNPMANSPVHIPYKESKQQNVVASQMHNQSLPIGVTSREPANYSNEHDDEAARAQIYKSQPPPPALPPQYQTMTNATTVLLSEALVQLHMDNIKQPVKNSQLQ